MDVIVIGCGAAGVAALRKLHDAGLKVLGLEAKDRIGGRINTVPFGVHNIDLGATWCHGQVGNKIYELANPLGLIGDPSPEDLIYYRSNGDISKEADNISNVLDDILSKVDKDNDKGILETLKNAAKTNETLKNNPELTNSVIEWFERNNHLGGQDDPRAGKSLKGLIERQVCEGEFWQHWKGKGYKTILDILLNKYPDPSKAIPVEILLNKEVETIKWSAADEQTNSLVQVKCKDGSLYAAKTVLVTVSVGVLKKRHATLFNPPLPSDRVTAINTLQMCVLDKIYVEFEKPWWKNFIKYPILWREEDKAKFVEDKWVTEIYQIQSVEAHDNVLLLWFCGKGAESMERVSEAEIKKGIEKFLDVVFGKFKLTSIKKFVRSQWSLDPHTYGSYAYRSIMTEQEGGSAMTLSTPLCHKGKPVVCFAGEATSHHHHCDAHGAVESGFREAERIIKSLKN